MIRSLKEFLIYMAIAMPLAAAAQILFNITGIVPSFLTGMAVGGAVLIVWAELRK